jgi:hypothetical protein
MTFFLSQKWLCKVLDLREMLLKYMVIFFKRVRRFETVFSKIIMYEF